MKAEWQRKVDVLSDAEILSKVSAQSLVNRGWQQYGGTMVAISISMFIVGFNTFIEYICRGRATYPEEYKVYAYVIAMCLEIVYDSYRVLTGKHSYYAIQEEGSDFFAERLRDFLLITLGEAVILLLTPYYNPAGEHAAPAQQVYATQLASCFLLFLFAYQYYEKFAIKDEEEQHEHEHNQGAVHSHFVPFLFKWLHLALAICVFFTSSALGLLYGKVYHAKSDCVARDDLDVCVPQVILEFCDNEHWTKPWKVNGTRSDNDFTHSVSSITPDHLGFVSPSTMLATSVAFFVIFMTLLRSLRGKGEWSFKKENHARLLAKISKLVFAVLHFCMAAFAKSKPYKVIAGHCALLAANTLSDGQTKGFFSHRMRRWFLNSTSGSLVDDDEERMAALAVEALKRKNMKNCKVCGRSPKLLGACIDCGSVQAKVKAKRGAITLRPESRRLTAERVQPTVNPVLTVVYNSGELGFVSNPMARMSSASTTRADAAAIPAAESAPSLLLSSSSALNPGGDQRSVSRNMGRIALADDPLNRSASQRLSISGAQNQRRNIASATASAASAAAAAAASVSSAVIDDEDTAEV